MSGGVSDLGACLQTFWRQFANTHSFLSETRCQSTQEFASFWYSAYNAQGQPSQQCCKSSATSTKSLWLVRVLYLDLQGIGAHWCAWVTCGNHIHSSKGFELAWQRLFKRISNISVCKAFLQKLSSGAKERLTLCGCFWTLGIRDMEGSVPEATRKTSHPHDWNGWSNSAKRTTGTTPQIPSPTFALGRIAAPMGHQRHWARWFQVTCNCLLTLPFLCFIAGSTLLQPATSCGTASSGTKCFQELSRPCQHSSVPCPIHPVGSTGQVKSLCDMCLHYIVLLSVYLTTIFYLYNNYIYSIYSMFFDVTHFTF